jgi:hypothetical protein
MQEITLTPSRDNYNIQLQVLRALQKRGWTGSWDVTDGKINIKAKEIISLDKRISEKSLYYPHAVSLVLCLGAQLEELSDGIDGEKYGVLFLNLNDIIIIDNTWYLLINLSKVFPLTKENSIELYNPIPLNGFMAPELENVKTLPVTVSHTCAYYSLALLTLHTMNLLGDPGIDTIIGSRLFYLLERCLNKNPKERHFLYV